MSGDVSGDVSGRRARCDPLTAFTTPVNAPAYAPPPYRFTDREYFRIVYRTDLDAVRGVVPEPLTVADPLVRFEVIRMPDSTGFGSYHECGQIAIADHDGRQVDFNIGLYVDSVSAIVGGRELGGYPKTGGTPRLYVDSDTLVATLDYGTLRVATGTMGFKHRERDRNEAIEELCLPVHQLKVVRGTGGALRVCELVQTSMTDLVVKGAWTAPGRLQLFEHALAPLADLPVREVISATHTLTDLTLGEAQTVHDYLEK